MRPRAAIVSIALAPVLAMAQHTTLKNLHDQARPVLIFAPADDARVQQQLAELRPHGDALRERDMQVILIPTHPELKAYTAQLPIATFTPDEGLHARERFHVQPNEFAVILVGKDGGEKLRSSSAMSWQRLSSTVDAMPMRKDEMRQR